MKNNLASFQAINSLCRTNMSREKIIIVSRLHFVLYFKIYRISQNGIANLAPEIYYRREMGNIRILFKIFLIKAINAHNAVFFHKIHSIYYLIRAKRSIGESPTLFALDFNLFLNETFEQLHIFLHYGIRLQKGI